MSGWIKMRASLLHSSKIVAVADRLNESHDFIRWACPGVPFDQSPLSHPALKAIACTAVMQIWSSAREFGRFDGEDLLLPNITVHGLDGLADVPGIGAAMELVGWVVDDEENGGVRLPNFKQFNVPMPKEKPAPLSDAERQKRSRDRKRHASVTKCHEMSRTVTTREEKSREDSQSSPTSSSSLKSPASGEGLNGLHGAGKRGLVPPFDTVTDEALGDARTLRRWFLDSAAAISLNPSESAFELTCAAALQAVAEGRSKTKLFKKLLKDKAGQDSIKAQYRARAAQFAKGAA